MTNPRASGSIVLLAALIVATAAVRPVWAEEAQAEDEDRETADGDTEDDEASPDEEESGAEDQAVWERRARERRDDDDDDDNGRQPAPLHQQISSVGEIVNVIDASDGDDRFDFTFRVGYEYRLTRVKLTQQCPPGRRSEWGCAPNDHGVMGFRDVARYNQIQHILNLEAIFGIYRDLEVYTNWPIILQDRREVVHLEENSIFWDDNEHLISFPFHSADRFGVDQFSLGVSWLPFSQERNPTLPTWLVNLEGQFAIGDPIQPACREDTGQVAPSDFIVENDAALANRPCNTEGGISERHHDVILRMTLSRRFGIVEPYIGFMAEVEFPEETDWQRYGHGGYNYPLYAEAHFGMEVVPWERTERRQFLRIGIHLWGGYNRETLNFGPLYDVLGTNPNMRYRYSAENPSADWGDQAATGRADDFTGLTRIEGHGSFGGRLTLTLQVARYVKFSLGAVLGHDQEHFVTFSDQCRVPRGGESGSWDGPNDWDCMNTNTIFVEEWRPQIDSIGRRFRAEETTIFHAFANVNVQF